MKHCDFPWSFGGFSSVIFVGVFRCDCGGGQCWRGSAPLWCRYRYWGEKGREKVGTKRWKKVGYMYIYIHYIYIYIFFFRTGENPRRTGFWNFLEESGKERTTNQDFKPIRWLRANLTFFFLSDLSFRGNKNMRNCNSTLLLWKFVKAYG